MKSAILLFLVPWCWASQYSSFIASFQSLGHWSENEYLEYKNNLPEIKVFTVCHWVKNDFFSERFNTIWAYCQHQSKNDTVLRCIEAMYTAPNEKGEIEFTLGKFTALNWFEEKKEKGENPQLRISTTVKYLR